MPPKLSYEYVCSYFYDCGFELLENEYVHSSVKMTIKDKTGYKYFCSYSYMQELVRENNKIKFVDPSNPYTIENIVLWIKVNNRPFKYLKGEYKKSNVKSLICVCDKCSEEFDTSWGDIYEGDGCPYCAGKRVSLEKSLLTLYHDIALEWDYDKNEKLPSEYAGKSHASVHWICSKCGHQWQSIIANRTNLGRGCPKCNQSKGENRIENYLLLNNKEYEKQFRFSDCKYKYTLPFDFYISENKICIEYDGIFHFKEHPKKKTDDWGLEDVKLRDSIKTQYCLDNSIKLIRIPYWDFNNIENILSKELNIAVC